jgi:ABC-type glycerol-3-phosphate transport system substrate-binding protein
MKTKFATVLATCALLLTSTLTACSGDEGTTPNNDPSDSGPSGAITVITHRTDLLDNGTFDAYVEQFNETYPDIKVTFEGITDYEGEIPMRLNTGDYGDVLDRPTSVRKDQFSQFFEPLGSQSDLEAKCQFLDDVTYEGQVYGLAQGGNASGLVYNKKVFADAGVTTVPQSIEEFQAALEAIRDKGNAIPLYTNYKDNWPLGGLYRNLGANTGDPEALNKMANSDAPWTEGTDVYYNDSILFDAVAAGCTEPDPLTTNWEQSKGLLGSGKVGAMILASWSVSQMQAAAVDAGASADDIGFMAYPSAVAGKTFAALVGDYYWVINKNSENKVAARAWVDWFIEVSPYSEDEGFISALRSKDMPGVLADLDAEGTELIELAPEPDAQNGLWAKINSASEIAYDQGDYRQKLVDIARGAASGDKASAFADLNAKWQAGRAEALAD